MFSDGAARLGRGAHLPVRWQVPWPCSSPRFEVRGSGSEGPSSQCALSPGGDLEVGGHASDTRTSFASPLEGSQCCLFTPESGRM